jgi:hypothetical protein
MRYLLVYVCLFGLAFPALWILMQLITNLSFYWRVSGGSMPLHHVGYYFISFVFAVSWVVGILITEASFRKSIDAVRMRRARTSPGPALTQEPPNKMAGWLRQAGLDVFAPRLAKVAMVVLGLFLLEYLIDSAFFYLLLG